MHSLHHTISHKYLYAALALAVLLAAVWMLTISRAPAFTGGGTAGDESLQITVNSPVAESTF